MAAFRSQSGELLLPVGFNGLALGDAPVQFAANFLDLTGALAQLQLQVVSPLLELGSFRLLFAKAGVEFVVGLLQACDLRFKLSRAFGFPFARGAGPLGSRLGSVHFAAQLRAGSERLIFAARQF